MAPSDTEKVVLAVETSCDETSVAVMAGASVRSNSISSQLVHAGFGGVVPELASRAHLRLMEHVTNEALSRAGIGKEDISAVASTYGPGLAGALLVGLTFGKAVAFGLGAPFIGVNHLEGHLYSNFIGDPEPEHPFLCLIVSGGHTMLVLAKEPFHYEILGQTRDDAAGEAFDKTAKMLGLGYPGGPRIDALAREGNPSAIRFPRPYLEEGSLDFSFSGLKTAVLYFLRDRGLRESVDRSTTADIAASFQEAMVDVLTDKTMAAAEQYSVTRVCLAGGVSANSGLRDRMSRESKRRGMQLAFPPPEYCMDNAAMIGYVGWLRMRRGWFSGADLGVQPNLSL